MFTRLKTRKSSNFSHLRSWCHKTQFILIKDIIHLSAVSLHLFFIQDYSLYGRKCTVECECCITAGVKLYCTLNQMFSHAKNLNSHHYMYQADRTKAEPCLVLLVMVLLPVNSTWSVKTVIAFRFCTRQTFYLSVHCSLWSATNIIIV